MKLIPLKKNNFTRNEIAFRRKKNNFIKENKTTLPETNLHGANCSFITRDNFSKNRIHLSARVLSAIRQFGHNFFGTYVGSSWLSSENFQIPVRCRFRRILLYATHKQRIDIILRYRMYGMELGHPEQCSWNTKLVESNCGDRPLFPKNRCKDLIGTIFTETSAPNVAAAVFPDDDFLCSSLLLFHTFELTQVPSASFQGEIK